eukprot:CAMPEP_0172360534 /NCGR_PEP_ID=MMETSP1060-20121228/4546_1 /TAXON_ID=37318 /ORGANISM="Pseudo-nitzschia pungens, Strain cf. cingulata" /LENGTH=404 /DNA_ID=CAMNT_0013082557 /DNA_START=420 /DNA_END=1634 /DNA_ORIENTATION=+
MGLFNRKKKNPEQDGKQSQHPSQSQQQQQQRQHPLQKIPEKGRGPSGTRAASPSSMVAMEHADRTRFDRHALNTANRESKRSLVALAYETTTPQSFRDKGKSEGKGKNQSKNGTSTATVPPPPTTPRPNKVTAPPPKRVPPPPIQTTPAPSKSSSSSSAGGGLFTKLNPVRWSFFERMCDDAFDSIDIDRSGEINESELYQGLLLIHLKLGLYFGAPACKPISAENVKSLFRKLDTNRDGSLDKTEFRNVLVLLMGNVVARIVFQFVCMLVIVPLVAATVLDSVGRGWTTLTGIVVPLWERYEPLVEVALGWDLVKKYSVAALGYLQSIEPLHAAGSAVAELWESFVAAPVRDVPQDTWDSLPLTMVSTMLSLMIVPMAILRTDGAFQFLALKISGGGGSSKRR